MTRVRRMSFIVAVLWWTAIAPARAHVCTSPVAVPVDEPVAVPVGVGAEQEAVTGVDIEVPSGFRLARVRPAPGWAVGGTGTRVELRGGSIPPFGCGSFTLEGTARRRGTLAFPLVVHGADGTTRRLDGPEPGTADSAQLVYAGAGNDAGDGSVPVGTVVGIVLLVVGLAGAAWWGIRNGGRRRARPSP